MDKTKCDDDFEFVPNSTCVFGPYVIPGGLTDDEVAAFEDWARDYYRLSF